MNYALRLTSALGSYQYGGCRFRQLSTVMNVTNAARKILLVINIAAVWWVTELQAADGLDDCDHCCSYWIVCFVCRAYTMDRYEPKIYALYHTSFQQVRLLMHSATLQDPCMFGVWQHMRAYVLSTITPCHACTCRQSSDV